MSRNNKSAFWALRGSNWGTYSWVSDLGCYSDIFIFCLTKHTRFFSSESRFLVTCFQSTEGKRGLDVEPMWSIFISFLVISSSLIFLSLVWGACPPAKQGTICMACHFFRAE